MINQIEYYQEPAHLLHLFFLCLAATLLPGGRTIHSKFKAPVEDLHDQSRCQISSKKGLVELIKRTKLIIGKSNLSSKFHH